MSTHSTTGSEALFHDVNSLRIGLAVNWREREREGRGRKRDVNGICDVWRSFVYRTKPTSFPSSSADGYKLHQADWGGGSGEARFACVTYLTGRPCPRCIARSRICNGLCGPTTPPSDTSPALVEYQLWTRLMSRDRSTVNKISAESARPNDRVLVEDGVCARTWRRKWLHHTRIRC